MAVFLPMIWICNQLCRNVLFQSLVGLFCGTLSHTLKEVHRRVEARHPLSLKTPPQFQRYTLCAWKAGRGCRGGPFEKCKLLRIGVLFCTIVDAYLVEYSGCSSQSCCSWRSPLSGNQHRTESQKRCFANLPGDILS